MHGFCFSVMAWKKYDQTLINGQFQIQPQHVCIVFWRLGGCHASFRVDRYLIHDVKSKTETDTGNSKRSGYKHDEKDLKLKLWRFTFAPIHYPDMGHMNIWFDACKIPIVARDGYFLLDFTWNSMHVKYSDRFFCYSSACLIIFFPLRIHGLFCGSHIDRMMKIKTARVFFVCVLFVNKWRRTKKLAENDKLNK